MGHKDLKHISGKSNKNAKNSLDAQRHYAALQLLGELIRRKRAERKRAEHKKEEIIAKLRNKKK